MISHDFYSSFQRPLPFPGETFLQGVSPRRQEGQQEEQEQEAVQDPRRRRHRSTAGGKKLRVFKSPKVF